MKHTTPKYLFWRGNSLWSRYKLPGRPQRYPLEIYSDGSATDKKKQEILGAAIIGKLSTEIIEGRFFDKKEAEVPVYRPKAWKVFARYWWFHLQFRVGTAHASYMRMFLRQFGAKYWDEVTSESVVSWLQTLKVQGHTVNTINSYLRILKAAFQYCVDSSKLIHTHIPKPVRGSRIDKSPIDSVKILPGGKTRQYLLTKSMFEKCYKWFVGRYPLFATFYLGIWLLGRRPKELSKYTWEMVQEHVIAGQMIHCFYVPTDICKMDEPDIIPIPERLWEAIFSQPWRTGLVFRNSHNTRWKQWWCQWTKLRQAFPDSDVGVYRDGRRGFASYQVRELGRSQSDVKQMTGHKTDSMFSRYCLGTLKGKLKITHPGLSEKRDSEGTEKGTKCA